MTIEELMAQQAISHIVRKMAQQAIALGADADDNNGAVQHVVAQTVGKDVWAWFAVCREIRDLQPPKQRIGFVG